MGLLVQTPAAHAPRNFSPSRIPRQPDAPFQSILPPFNHPTMSPSLTSASPSKVVRVRTSHSLMSVRVKSLSRGTRKPAWALGLRTLAEMACSSLSLQRRKTRVPTRRRWAEFRGRARVDTMLSRRLCRVGERTGEEEENDMAGLSGPKQVSAITGHKRPSLLWRCRSTVGKGQIQAMWIVSTLELK